MLLKVQPFYLLACFGIAKKRGLRQFNVTQAIRNCMDYGYVSTRESRGLYDDTHI